MAARIDDWETRAWCPFCSYVPSEACCIHKWLIHYSVCTAYRDVRQIAWSPEISMWEKITYQWHCLRCRSARVPSELLSVESFWLVCFKLRCQQILFFSYGVHAALPDWKITLLLKAPESLKQSFKWPFSDSHSCCHCPESTHHCAIRE